MNWLCIFVFALFMVSCQDQEEGQGQSTVFESTAVVELQPFVTDLEEIDWNAELRLLRSREVLKRVSAATDLSLEEVQKALHIEFDVDRRRVKMTGSDEQQEGARVLVSSMAQAYQEVREAQAWHQAHAEMKRLEESIAHQEIEKRAAYERLHELLAKEENLSFGNEETLEQDRMTYEKAKAALQEQQSGQASPLLFEKEVKD